MMSCRVHLELSAFDRVNLDTNSLSENLLYLWIFSAMEIFDLHLQKVGFLCWLSQEFSEL